MTDTTSRLLDELRACGEKLPAPLRDRIIAEGQPIVPSLIDVLSDDDDQNQNEEDDEGDWASIHAVSLLADLKAETAIGPMLRVLAETEWDYLIHDRIVLQLPELGAPVLEPALALLAEDPPEDLAESLCSIASRLGVRDERLFQHLVAAFHESPGMGCGWLADYGDERAVPLLEREIENTVPDANSPFGLHPLVDLVEAYERLAGELPDDLRTHVDDLQKNWMAGRSPPPGPRTVAASNKIGRNDPCPCGSGKKYKRCHLGTDLDV